MRAARTIVATLGLAAAISVAAMPATADAKPSKPKPCKASKKACKKPKPCKGKPSKKAKKPCRRPAPSTTADAAPATAAAPAAACNVVGSMDPCPGWYSWQPTINGWMLCETAPTYICWVSGQPLFYCPPTTNAGACSKG